MSNPTSNFGWQMPTPTDLVTDLPADFEVFGQAVDTSLADLKGGTTGQILSKATNADMDFTWTTANPGDITEVTAGTGITGGGTSGAVTITNDMATTITAAGDIVVGTGSGTYDNLPIGTTNQVLTADTSVSPYKVKWASASGGKVVQIVSANHSTVASNSTNTYAATGLTATITPSSASNKILIWANIAEAHKSNQNANNQIQLGLKRGSTYLKETLGLYTGTAVSLSVPYSTIVYLDSPATTSATTYAVDFLNYNNTAAVKINDNMALFSTVGSSIILMEVTP